MNKKNFKLPKSKFKRSSYELAIEEGKRMSDQNKSYTEIRETLDEKYPSEQFYMQDIMASILQYAIKNKMKDKNMFKKMEDGGVTNEEIVYCVVIDEDDKNYNKVGYSLSETITDKEGNQFEKLYFENQKSPKKYSVNDISYLSDRGEFSKKDKLTGTTNYVILVDYQENKPYFYIYNTTEKFVATEGYNWNAIVKVAGIENSVYAHQIFEDGGKIEDIKVGDKIYGRWNDSMKWTLGTFKGETKNGFEVYNFTIERPEYIEYYSQISKLPSPYGSEKIFYSENFKDRNYKNYHFNKEYADGGGVPNTENSFKLPLEIAVYVPSTKNVNEVISVDEMNERENQVKTFLAERFGGYTMSDKLGGYVDNSGNIVNEEITQVVSFATIEAWEKYKNELVAKISEWADKWGQEAIGLEFEGDMFYIEKEPAMVMKNGGQLWIQNAVDKMKQKGTIGAFTKQAKREGLSTTEFAKKVLEKPEKYTLKTKRRAIFFKNTNPEKF